MTLGPRLAAVADAAVALAGCGVGGSNPYVARAAYRHYEDAPDYGDKHIDFRVVTP